MTWQSGRGYSRKPENLTQVLKSICRAHRHLFIAHLGRGAADLGPVNGAVVAGTVDESAVGRKAQNVVAYAARSPAVSLGP